MSDALALLEPEQLTEVVEHWQTEDRPFANTLTAGLPPAQALARLGVRLCLQERYPESLAVLRAAVTFSPEDPLLWNNLAVVLERAALPAEAIGAVERSLALRHEQPDSWLLLGNMLKNRGDLAGAERAYETTLSLEPQAVLAWQSLGLVKQERREFQAAIDCFLKCAHAGNATAPILAILGQLFYQTGQFEKSLHAYTAAADLDRDNAMHRQMKCRVAFLLAMVNGGEVDEALARCREMLQAGEGEPEGELLRSSFSTLSGYGHHEAARRVGEKLVALDPRNPTFPYLLQALAGDPSVARSPDAYLVNYFDHFAEGFDRQLTGTLGYDIPRKLGELIGALVPARAELDVLDIGCGTGLCGPHMRPFARTLTGVDISPGMLEQAERKQLYTDLRCEEITRYLRSARGAADVLVAADVFIYFGNLRELFELIAGAVRVGGLLAFSTERTEMPAHQLLPSGRFAHHPNYLRMLAAGRFEEVAWRQAVIRLEAARPVEGDLYVFRRL